MTTKQKAAPKKLTLEQLLNAKPHVMEALVRIYSALERSTDALMSIDEQIGMRGIQDLAERIYLRGATSILFNLDRFDDTEKVKDETIAKFDKLVKFSRLAAERFFPLQAEAETKAPKKDADF